MLGKHPPQDDEKRNTNLGVPPWSPFLSNNDRDFEASSLGILVFRGTVRPIRPDFDQFF